MVDDGVGSGLEVRLLGPLEVELAGWIVPIGSPKQRAVVALLALQAGRVVPGDALCDLLWDDDPPASPSATLQSLISRLRSALSASGLLAGREVLRTREPGWVLDVDPIAVDALRFQTLTARARRRKEQGEAVAAAADLADALRLWRGPALADVTDNGHLAGQATRLEEARLDAFEDLAEVELATGLAADVLVRLEEHVESNPLRERGWGLLMVTLYRLGRQAAALRAFQQVRSILGDELGIEPSPELVEIERRILRQDPALTGRVAPAPGRASFRTPGEPAPPAPPTPPPAPPVAVAPVVPPAGPMTEAPASARAGEFAEYTVVVVEDHDFQRRTVVQLLRGLGVGTVLDAANGAAALQVLQDEVDPDVIICDIDMPGMDGVEFVTRVAERNLACAVVIASGLEANVLRAVEAVGESHGLQVLAALEKPLTARRLGEVLRQYTPLRRERADPLGRGPLTGDELRDALGSGRLRVQLEPRIDLATGAVSSAEVGGLLDSVDGSPVSSSLFLPALAREDLLLAFVDRLLSESCAVLDEMGRAGLDDDSSLRLALNVSLLPITEGWLADRLAELVVGWGQRPRRFVCEIDDVVLAKAPAGALGVLTRLRVKGFGLSMSHGGAGPTWAHQMERVPLNELKLGRRLVSGARDDPKRLAVLEAVLGTGRSKGMAVVAAGCDSAADFHMLLALGCAEAQGQFVAPPMPAGALVAWAEAWNKENGSAGRS